MAIPSRFDPPFTSKTNHHPLPIHAEIDAVNRIKRCWHRHYAPVQILQNPQTVLAIPHQLLKRFIIRANKSASYKRNRQYANRLKFACTQAVQARQTHRKRVYIPIITSIGYRDPKIILPLYRLASKDSEFCYDFHLGVGYTPLAWELFSEMSKIPFQNKKEVDAFVQAISNIDIFAWKMSEPHCYARADLTIQFLKLMGVPSTHLGKQYLLTISHRTPSNGSDSSGYHVAPFVKLEDGSEWIIDPALSPKFALTLAEWIELLPSLVQTPIQNIENGQHLDAIFHRLEGRFAIKIPHDQIVHFSDDFRRYQLVTTSTEQMQKSIAKTLASSRANVEWKWIVGKH